MSYTIWIKVENDDGMPGDPDEAWWCVSPDIETREKAVEEAQEIADKRLYPDYDVVRLEDKWTGE